MPPGWGWVAQPCPGLSGSQAVAASSRSLDLRVPIFKMGVIPVLLSCGFLWSFKIRLGAQRTPDKELSKPIHTAEVHLRFWFIGWIRDSACSGAACLPEGHIFSSYSRGLLAWASFLPERPIQMVQVMPMAAPSRLSLASVNRQVYLCCATSNSLRDTHQEPWKMWIGESLES